MTDIADWVLDVIVMYIAWPLYFGIYDIKQIAGPQNAEDPFPA